MSTVRFKRTRRLLSALTPKSLLWQTFLNVSILLLLALLFWAQIFRYYSEAPRARDIAQNVVSIVNLTRMALINAEPAKRSELLVDLVSLEGVRIYPSEESDTLQPLENSRLMHLIVANIRLSLGAHTRFASKWKTLDGFWVSFKLDPGDEEEYWVTIPKERLIRPQTSAWAAWGAAVLIVALIGAFLLASRISIPLRYLARAAQMVGQGEMPPQQPEQGPEEITLVTRAFNQMTGNLSQAAADRELILASVSHDLRTPLARLRLGIEMSGAPAQETAAMEADIEEMDRIIGQFLDFGRERTQSSIEEIELCELVGSLIEPYRFRGSNVSLSASGPVSVSGGALSLRRALGNLVDNALRYGEGAGPIELRVYAEEDEAMVEVADRGPGIPDDEIERLRRPFTRLENARSNAKGAGLGLAIVERVLSNHNGRLELEAREGGGLIARICLPLAKKPKPSVEEKA